MVSTADVLVSQNVVKLRPASMRPTRKPPPLVWEGIEYPRYPPGVYDVRCNKIQGPEWLRNRRRWSLRLECNFLMDKGSVSGFLNLGDDPERVKAPRGSRYYKVWCLVNGGAPKKGQRMSPEDFLGKIFRVRVDNAKDIQGNLLPEGERYSKIVEFLELLGP